MAQYGVVVGCLSIDSVRAAARRMKGMLPKTPLRYSAARAVWLKLENVQETGSFKVRGALNALLAQAERGLDGPVIAASAGNHGAGVAWAARRLGLKAQIVVPHDAPRTKVACIRRLGATVIHCGADFDESLVHAKTLARRHGWRFVHAFDDLDVMAGQGTIALELMPARPDVVTVPIGGGGLAAGMAVALHAMDVPLIGVQVEGLNAMQRALAQRVPVSAAPGSLCDGLRVRDVGTMTRALCASYLTDIVTVTEQCVRETVASLAVREGLRVEGAGAVALAAMPVVSGQRRIALVSGGNIDSEVLRTVVQTGQQFTSPPRPMLQAVV